MNGEVSLIIECRCNDMDYRKDNPEFPYTRFGKPHNGKLVEMIANMARTLGREVATPAQAREILKMPQRSHLSAQKVAAVV